MGGQPTPADGVSDGAARSNGPLPLFQPTTLHNLPMRSAMSRFESNESNSEDFRSVIDDLTIENKLLKQKLRAYEQIQSSSSSEDRLFELKLHKMPSNKKRELEDVLRNFASSIDTSPNRYETTRAPDRGMPKKNSANPSSSSTSDSRPVDSAYASMSTSGKTSAAQSARAGPAISSMGRPQSSETQKVHSYLHDIPKGLLPRHSPMLTEKARRKLVVRRLEQLFTGKGHTGGENSQPLQQQEVSQSAAHADRSAKEANGQRITSEGTREAHILPVDVELASEAGMEKSLLELHLPGLSEGSRSMSRSGETGYSGNDSPDQRPTRPLDLDPHRAQYPAENIEYIRHLGLSSPKMNPEDAELDNDGWVYLNLLTNMAQLHTINVTPEFVRKAVADVSSKFELSHDGRKIKWKGGTEGSRLSSDTGSNGDHASADSSEEQGHGTQFSHKRRKVDDGTSTNTFRAIAKEPTKPAQKPRNIACTPGTRRPIPTECAQPPGKLSYRPMFFHASSRSDTDDEKSEESDSATSVGRKFASTQLHLSKRLSRKKPDQETIIFYHRAKFCTDLTGDRNGSPVESGSSFQDGDALGQDSKEQLDARPRRAVDHFSDTLTPEYMDIDAKSENDAESPESTKSLRFSPTSTHANDMLVQPAPVYLEATGVGGVQPADNFMINVRTAHVFARSGTKISPFSAPKVQPHRILHSIPQTSIEAFLQDNPARTSILSSTTVPLLPSDLPPPSSLFIASSSAEDSSSDGSTSPSTTSEDSLSSASQHFPTTTTHQAPPQPAQKPPFHPITSPNSSRGSHSPADSSDTDSSIDLLAPARMLDPELIAAREREFDVSVKKLEELAELPAGSSAATAGGGSGSGWDSSDSEELAIEDLNADVAEMRGLKRRASADVDAWGSKLPRMTV